MAKEPFASQRPLRGLTPTATRQQATRAHRLNTTLARRRTNTATSLRERAPYGGAAMLARAGGSGRANTHPLPHDGLEPPNVAGSKSHLGHLEMSRMSRPAQDKDEAEDETEDGPGRLPHPGTGGKSQIDHCQENSQSSRWFLPVANPAPEASTSAQRVRSRQKRPG